MVVLGEAMGLVADVLQQPQRRRVPAQPQRLRLSRPVDLLLALGHGIVHFIALWNAIDGLPLFNWVPIIGPLALLALQPLHYRGPLNPPASRQRPAAAGATAKKRASTARDDVEEVVIDAKPKRSGA